MLRVTPADRGLPALATSPTNVRSDGEVVGGSWQAGVVPPKRRAATPGIAWDEVALAPIVLVRGKEDLLAERAITRLRRLAREQAEASDPGLTLEVTQLEAATYQSGQLATLSSPSLFAEPRHLEITGLEALSEAFAADLVDYLRDPAPDVSVVLWHAGGQRGKKVLEALTTASVPTVVCDEVAERDKGAFVSAEFRRAKRRIEGDAVIALVEAVGSDLRELASAADQLVSDTTGTISAEVIDRYYGGRVEATGFKVADAAVAGQAGQALALARHAMATGTDPVPLVAALALKLRSMGKVAAMRGRSIPAGKLGLAPWQIDRAKRDLQGWTPEGLAGAISAVAAADAEIKGEGRAPQFAVERAVLQVAQARTGRR